MEKDVFGFADAIEIELINEDNLKIVDIKKFCFCTQNNIKILFLEVY